ncbi:response regulator [Nocardioides limicola]|uniref:response regulator n=1 Tax=Nocardioides limicola TaxID=2803368 RepID=UPI00193B0806|nr:response regulator transcription factor [Nocardioides sp. DJM-14]
MTQGEALEGAPDPVRVFLVDDHEIVRQGVRELLARQGGIEVVGEADSVAQALQLIPVARPHVAVLDDRLPDGSGVEVCREIRSKCPNIAVLILTAYDDESLFDAITAGAAGYLLKQVRGSDLVRTIRTLAAGGSTLDPAVTRQVLERVRGGDAEDPALASLTHQERRILELLGEGMTNRQIAEAMFLAEKTVKNYVSTVLGKLNLERRAQAAVYASKHLP